MYVYTDRTIRHKVCLIMNQLLSLISVLGSWGARSQDRLQGAEASAGKKTEEARAVKLYLVGARAEAGKNLLKRAPRSLFRRNLSRSQ